MTTSQILPTFKILLCYCDLQPHKSNVMETNGQLIKLDETGERLCERTVIDHLQIGVGQPTKNLDCP